MVDGTEFPTETKIANLLTVREHCEGDTVELWLNRAGRLVVRAFNEYHNNHTDVDLGDLLSWLQTGGCSLLKDREHDKGVGAVSSVPPSERDK
jgi:hypothetical protein